MLIEIIKKRVLKKITYNYENNTIYLNKKINSQTNRIFKYKLYIIQHYKITKVPI